MNLPENKINTNEVISLIKIALEEDIGSGDVTTKAIVSSNEGTSAQIVAKEQGVICGLAVAEMVFRELDKNIKWEAFHSDGDSVENGTEIATIAGSKSALLTGERTALNFLQRMSGIASITRKYVEKTDGFPARILDTRKTIPGFRTLDKYAVKCGGGENHRFGLYDLALVKENHITLSGGIKNAVGKIRKKYKSVKIEIETTNMEEIEEALELYVDYIMLDNMSPELMKEAVKYINGRIPVEASGGITLEKIPEIAASGVNYISVGAITHSVKALDLTMLIEI